MYTQKRAASHMKHLCENAAAGGHLHVLMWARKNGCVWSTSTCTAAAGGHLEVLKWALAHDCPCNYYSTCDEAIRFGHLNVLEWTCVSLRGNEWEHDIRLRICTWAADYGQLEILKWARNDAKCEWNTRTTCAAARSGHLDVLKWAYANGYALDRHACEKAATQHSHSHILGWIHATL